MTIQTIKLSKLALSPLNVRTVEPSKIEAMASDIEAHGLLQNLIGHEKGGKVLICAGGRRYRALKLLQKNKTITGSYEVPVDIRDEAEAIELSLPDQTL
ncbi:ParB/Srx family N-terminal domain-containing protein [Erythrobacter sp. LQ02-29]|uniref:ParB/Srx family N-terminal domain-containing protein n=1 Tax=Erythrobacter sp. LQ02-29 TaxID=2920384 RepID=UPI001F4D767C|nr:ParB/Srx family N-terminal domain-containing protein [Erythrobacter sp. LQ02-29]MCP9223895.1 ParB/Srx family N-terminal domain-containing protein [Erythrobacter sp. LQ02-29]